MLRKTLNLLAAWLDRLHWLWLALAAPFLLFPSPKRSLAMLVVPVLWLLHWLVVSSDQLPVTSHQSPVTSQHEAGRRRQTPIPLTPLNGALLLMALMVLVSEWATFDLAHSLPKISGMVLGLGVFFAVAREGARPRGWWLSLLAFLSIGLGIAALGILGTRWASSKITLINPVIARLPTLIKGLQGAESGFHPNEVAGALIWALPVMIAVSVALIGVIASRRCTSGGVAIPFSTGKILLNGRLLREKRPRNDTCTVEKRGADTQGKMHGWRLVGVTVLCLLATLFVGAVFVLTQSRGGYLGLALTLPLLILIALPPRWRWYSLIFLIVLAVVLGFVISSQWEAIRSWVTGSDLAADPALSLNSLQGRLEVWSRAVYGIQDFPFTGMGMNAFRKVVPVLYPLFLVSPDVDIGHAHNEFLQAALDLGIPGLLSFIAIYIIAFWMLADIWRNVPTFNLQCATVLGLSGGLLAHMFYGLTDAVALGAKPGLLFWMLLGLIAGLYGQYDKEKVASIGYND